MTRADAVAFFTVIALLLPAVLTTAEDQQKRIDTINQEQMHGHRQFNR